MKRCVFLILIIGLICYFSGNLFAKIDKLEVDGIVKIYWNYLNNGFDKTTTRVLSSGVKLYDDLDEYAYTFIAVRLNMYVMENVKIALRLGKNDTLWASHNAFFNPEHTQTVGNFLGESSPADSRNYGGIKVDRLFIEADDIVWGYVNFIGGRQLYSGTVYEEANTFKDIPQDLFVYFVSDGLVFKMNGWDFLFFEPQMKTELFAFKINDNTADLYSPSGGYTWERKYGDGDQNLYGLINKIIYKDHSIKNYFLVYDKGGKKLTQGDSNIDGYDNRYIIGLSYANQKFFSKYIKISAEAGYILGKRAIGTYYDLDNSLNWVQKNYYDEAKYDSYIYRAGIEFKKAKFTVSVFNVGGRGDDPSTPDTIEGFYGFNESFYTRVYGNEFGGYGEILKATPYMHNYASGSPLLEEDERYVDPSVARFPLGVIGGNINYLIGALGDDENKFIPMVEYFYYYTLGYPIVALDRNNSLYKVNSAGMEVDVTAKYLYKNNFIIKLVYGLYLPGNTFAAGYNQLLKEELGRDPVELIKCQVDLYF
ncbi:MAG: hypothetical protein KKH98_01395 [Spirochaetes bacterium]|nr:hypothetical protein [Spirochaetota bacterium]